jgi:phospholipid/cholesterol/gamma-HCH transport system substrate-binding protein
MNDNIIGYDSPTFDQILSSVQGLSSRLDSVLNNVSILVINTNNSVKNLNNDVRNSISKINYILSEVSLLIEHQSNNLDTIAVNVNRTINLSQQTLKSLDSLINLAKIEIDSLKYRGTIGKLSQSDSLYIEIKRSILKIQELIDDIKKNPSKYINLKIF